MSEFWKLLITWFAGGLVGYLCGRASNTDTRDPTAPWEPPPEC